MEFYSVINKNEILSFAGKGMELENIILSEVIQVQKAKGYMFSLICGIIGLIQIQAILCLYRNMYRACTQKGDW
jgi:hypothetical protein